jgi:citrate synthase
VDGTAGRLVIRGRPLEMIAGNWRFEDAVALLWDGFVAVPAEELQRSLAAARTEVYRRTLPSLSVAAGRPIFDGLRLLMALLPDGTDPESALLATAAPGVLVPALVRLAGRRGSIMPDETLPHAADVLRMLTGGPAEPAWIAELDTYLVTVADHGLNASTFAARVIASTQAGLTSAMLGALGALKGPLHGGAPGPVLDMLDAIGTPEAAPAWIEAALGRGERLMGFGHRIYRVRDPRADALAAALARLRKSGAADPARMALAARVEEAALAALARHKPDRALKTNVEFYTALLLEAIEFPREAFTAVFAMGRVAGWIAHAREQATTGRLIRPRSLYVGPEPREAA